MLGHTGFLRSWGNRRRGSLAVVGAVLALTGIAIALVSSPASQAAQGTKWPTGMPAAGVLTTDSGQCSVAVVSEWLAITAKHCGTGNPDLKLNVPAFSAPGQYPVKSITVSPDLDVEAIFLRSPTGLTVAPLRASVAQGQFSVWGYGRDHSNNNTGNLTRADFNGTQPCPSTQIKSQGALCWQTTATNSVCSGDSGGAVTQNGAIIGIVTAGDFSANRPNGAPDCSTSFLGQALTVQEMQPWLDQMIKAANPVP